MDPEPHENIAAGMMGGIDEPDRAPTPSGMSTVSALEARERQMAQFQMQSVEQRMPDLERQLDPERELTLANVVTPSKYAKLDLPKQIEAIVQDYNKNITKENDRVIVPAGARSGDRVEPGMFLVAHMNKVPEIAAGKGDRLTLRMTSGYTETGFIGAKDGLVRQTEPVIGDYGVYVINVPQGQYGLVWSGQQTPKILDEGPHVIHDSQFRCERGKMFARQGESHISHGILHILRVPVGYYFKVTVETKPMLLPYRKEPYVFNTPLFEFNGQAKTSDPYISYGPIHMIRVPAGSVAKVWLGSRALLLEYRNEPYFFEDPEFRPAGNESSMFVSATSKQVTHGSISRLRPGVNGDLENAVIQLDGNLYFIDRFTTIDNQEHAILGFLNMGMQTYVFPSKETRLERQSEKRMKPDEIAFEPMTTRDSLKVGLKLLVAFQVSDPHRVMRKLRMQDIMSHVENLAVSDMARAVQNSTSQNFLHSSGKTHDELEAEEELSITDSVKLELKNHLEDCGLKLIRFNIEEAKVLDEELAREMAKQALVAAKASAEQAVIEQRAAVAKAEANVEAMKRRVKQESENQIKVTEAKGDLEVAKLTAEGEVEMGKARNQVMNMQGEMFRQYPELMQLELAKIQANALQNWKVTLIAPELASTPFGTFPTGAPLTAGAMATASAAKQQ